MNQEPESCDVAIAGGGPAGLFLANLLTRLGQRVVVLEKYPDFRRDWRGDTVHPTTLGLIDKMGLGEQFAQIPSGKLTRMRMMCEGREVTLADFRRLPMKHKHIAMVPQWDLLNLIAEDAHAQGQFTLLQQSEVLHVVRSDDRVTGLRYRDADGEEHTLHALLTVAADGRWSAVRRSLGWPLRENRIGMDVWQIRIPKAELTSWHAEVLGSYRNGLAAVAQDRHDYVQTAFLIKKGTDANARARGLGWLRRSLQELFGWPDAAVDTITDWADVPFLQVTSGLLDTWSAEGVVCIGDAAHPMSPAGGVGVNLAVQDALALANLCARSLDEGLTQKALRPVLRHRQRAAKLIQKLQRGEERGIIMPALEGRLPTSGLPAFLKIPAAVPGAPSAAAILSSFMALPSRVDSRFVEG